MKDMKEKIREFIGETVYHVTGAILMAMEAFKMKLAILLADMKQRAYNRRFFVVLITVGFNKKGIPIERLRSIDNQQFKLFKRKGWLPKRMTTCDLQQKCFYATPLSKNNTLNKEERKAAINKYIRYRNIMNKIL